MKIWWTAIGKGALSVLYYLLYPIYWTLSWLFYILYWILSPCLYVANLLKKAAVIPFHFLGHFEALWYFLASAIFVGIVLALSCHFILRALVVVFQLDRAPAPKPIPPVGHDAVSYRAAREEKKNQKLELEKAKADARKARLYAAQPVITPPQPASAISRFSPGTRRHALSREIILEHTDEEDDDSVF